MNSCSGGWWSSSGARIVFWEALAKCAQRAGFGGSVERSMSYDDLLYRVDRIRALVSAF